MNLKLNNICPSSALIVLVSWDQLLIKLITVTLLRCEIARQCISLRNYEEKHSC